MRHTFRYAFPILPAFFFALVNSRVHTICMLPAWYRTRKSLPLQALPCRSMPFSVPSCVPFKRAAADVVIFSPSFPCPYSFRFSPRPCVSLGGEWQAIDSCIAIESDGVVRGVHACSWAGRQRFILIARFSNSPVSSPRFSCRKAGRGAFPLSRPAQSCSSAFCFFSTSS